MSNKLWDQLADWKKNCKWVDLSLELSPDTPHWHGFEALAVKPAYTYESTDGIFMANYYTIAGQYGTHIDFPRHFHPEGRWQHEFDVKDVAWPLVVIDVSGKVKANPDYELSAEDVLDWEKANGKVPEGCFVAMRSDWSKRKAEDYNCLDAQGGAHYPGWGMDALKVLVEERNVAGFCHETADTDSAVHADATNMGCEKYVCSHDKLNVELLRNLDQVPATGALIFVTYPNIRDGVGFNARVFAICPGA
jgi:kynurenine formamidase